MTGGGFISASCPKARRLGKIDAIRMLGTAAKCTTMPCAG